MFRISLKKIEISIITKLVIRAKSVAVEALLYEKPYKRFEWGEDET